jgi:long-subunit fatty acid transport protein
VYCKNNAVHGLQLNLYPKLINMKRYLLLTLSIISVSVTFAQTPDDALRTTWFTPNGTARYMATGGVMGSLGGDITAANINPAGLGLFKTNEFVFSPNFNINNNKFNYRGKDTSVKRNAFQLGTTGWVFGIPGQKGSNSSSAFSISINQLGSYNNRVSYKGFNNYSSFSEQYLEELVRDRADTNAALSNYIFGSSLAFRTWLIDTSNDAFGVFHGYQSLVTLPTGVNQELNATTTGGFHEIAIGGASNTRDKLYIGGTVTIPLSFYSRNLYYREADATSSKTNDFNYFELTEKSRSFGIGLGAKLGVIYKPKDYWRLGFALHTPQFMNFKDHVRATMTTDTEGYAGVHTETSDKLNNGKEGERQYNLITPWKAIASASYVFREVSDTRKQRAFISADIEYVNYRGARFYTTDENDLTAKDYYNNVNRAVKDSYKGNFNFRVGGELKLHTFMFRLGGAYYGSPYKDKDLQANRILATGGLGYRNKGFFIDLSYAHSFVKDVSFPYRLNDKANTFAVQTGSRGNVVATIGFKF